MKRKIALFLIMSCMLTSCGSAGYEPVKNPNWKENESNINTELENSESEENTGDISELENIGEIEVEENLFNVEITIPAEYVGESTQSDLDLIAEENGYKSITLNSDGSATYVMTKNQHKAMMDEMTISFNDSLAEMVGSENYPNFTDIKANDNFTEFTITTKSTELDMNESFSVLAFYMYGGMYNIFNGTTVDNISVTFINADSGEIISTANSSEASQ